MAVLFLLLAGVLLTPALVSAAVPPTTTPTTVAPPAMPLANCLAGQITGGCPAGTANPARLAEQQLAAKFAPIMELKQQTGPCDDKGEPYLPAPVDVALNDPQTVLRQNTGGADAAADPIVKRGPTTADLAGKSSAYYLDLPGDPLEPGCTYEQFSKQRMAGRQPIIYAHIVTDPDRGVVVQYWFYYVFNRFNNLHESDWEMIQLRFNAPSVAAALEMAKPDEVAYAQHGGGELAAWDDAKVHKDGTHPLVYPAAGSHASYYDSDVYLGWGERGSGLGCDDSTGPSVRVVPQVILVPDHPAPTGPFAWLTFQGRWGEKEPSVFNGPTGPNTKAQWSDPFAWEAGLRESSLPLGQSHSFGPNPTGLFCNAVSFVAGLYVDQKHYAWYTYSIVALLILVPLILFFLTRHLLGAALKLFIRHAPTFLAIGVGLVIVGAVATYVDDVLQAIPLAGGGAEALLGLITPGQFLFFEGGRGLASFLGWTLVTPAVIAVVAGLQIGQGPDFRRAYRVAFARYWTVVRAAARAAIVVILLLISVIGIPWALVKLIRWSLLSDAIVVDDTTWRQAGRVSERSVIGRWWRTAIILTVVGFLVTAIAPIAGMIFLIFVNPSVFWANAISGVVYALTFPFAGIVTALWYLQRRGVTTASRAVMASLADTSITEPSPEA